MLKLVQKFVVGILILTAFPALATFDNQDQMLKALMSAGAEHIIAFEDGLVNTRVWNATTQKIEHKHLGAIISEADDDIPALNYYQSELMGRRLWKARKIGDSFICYTPERNVVEQVAAENLGKNIYAPCFLITEKVSTVLNKLLP